LRGLIAVLVLAALLSVVSALSESALAAPGLYFTQSSDHVTIVAKESDDSAQYWQMVLYESGTRCSMITGFYDLRGTVATGFSDPTCNYVDHYSFSTIGLFQPLPEGSTYTVGAKANGSLNYTYTLDYMSGTVAEHSVVTINAPTPTGTHITALTTWTNTGSGTAYGVQTGPQGYCNSTWLYNPEGSMTTVWATTTSNLAANSCGTATATATVQNVPAAQANGLCPGLSFVLSEGDRPWGSAHDYLGTVWGVYSGTYNAANASLAHLGDYFMDLSLNHGVTDDHLGHSEMAAGEVDAHRSSMTINLPCVGGPLTAIAGPDQTVNDNNLDGSEPIILDGLDSYDGSGTITSYVWSESGSQIATGAQPTVIFACGVHVVTLTVTDNHGSQAMDTVTITVHPMTATTYYVDFVGGNDALDGTTPAKAWQHCPGDANVTGTPLTASLHPGDKVIFKGGVKYVGTIACNWSGLSGAPITYDGNTAGTFGLGQAIFDNSQPLTNWVQCTSSADALGNPNWQNIWYANAPAGTTANTSYLYQFSSADQSDHMCWLAEGPNQPDPFFMSNQNYFYQVPYTSVTTTAVTDPTHLNQTDPHYWDGAYIMVWSQPNVVVAQAVAPGSFTPSTNTIALSVDVTPYGAGYNGAYSLYNSIHLLDVAGEYYFNDTAQINSTHQVWLWPPVGDPNQNQVTVCIPSRPIAFDLGGSVSYLTFNGFTFQKLAGPGNGGTAIKSEGDTTGLVIENCFFTHIGTDYTGGNGYGAIWITAHDALITSNSFTELPMTNAIQINAYDSTISNNYMNKPGRMGMWMGFWNTQILHNTILNVNGPHADGIAVFQGSASVTIMYNTIYNCGVPLCTENSANIVVAYNYLYCPSFYAFGGYGGCTNQVLYNNLLRRDDDKPSLRNDSGSLAENNIMYAFGGQGSLTPDANHNLVLNQSMNATVFNNPAVGDFTLKAGSPAIRAGLYLGYLWDILGNPVANPPDIGCYERVVSYTGTDQGNGGTITVSSSGPYYYGTQVVITAAANRGYMFTGWSASGCSLSNSAAVSTTLTVQGNWTLAANFMAATLTASATLDRASVYQNTAATTLDRQCRTMTITVPQDSWPDDYYTVVVTQSGAGVVAPSLTCVAAGGSGAVTPTSSFVFTGSSATLYLVGSRRQADGVTGTGVCTVTIQVTGDVSQAANAATAQVILAVRPLGDSTGDGAVTTADRVQMRKWLNSQPTPDQTAADFDLDGAGAVTANDLSILNSILNNLAAP
jgi:hypothetical protein